ncbi:MAG: signal peptide peptidase SppA [Chloroflexi bacterium]|nr:signal peptide peptidase SppA [Chloroflexota bacterium]
MNNRKMIMMGAGAAAGMALAMRQRMQHRASVGVVKIQGMIRGGEGGGRMSGPGAFSERIVKWLRQAQQDPSIKAVVLRVDSPGGGVTASDEIYQEVHSLKHVHHKPVVVSMGSLAASGGYYISAPADRIIANPTTITGSIGVITMAPNYEELMEKVGVRMNVVKTGPYKDMASSFRPFTEQDQELLQGVLDDSYYRFVDIVAEGRNMDRAAVRALADGRIYTGRQAKAVGLVDEFGSLQDAINVAGRMAGLGDDPHTVEFAPQRRMLPFVAAALSGEWLAPELRMLLGGESRGLWYLYTGP